MKKKRKTSIITEIITSLMVLTLASTVLIAMTALWTSRLPGGKENFTPYILVAYILLFAIVIAVFGSLILRRIIILPLRNLLKATQEISQGNLNARVSISADNELAQLGEAFNKMAEEIQQKQKSLEQKLKELEQINQELRQTQDQLVFSEKMASVGKLAAGVAHEIGNPLSIIIGYLEYVSRSSNLSEQERESLKRAEEETRRINQIIRELLDYSRPVSQTYESVNINQIIYETLNLVKLQKGFDRIQTQLDLEESLPPVMGNRNQIKQVLVNLLLNARDAMPDGGILTLKTRRENQLVQIEIADTGIGIPEENLKKIFDPFFTTKEPGRGIGLGLSISLKIIETMGGKIEVESKSGQGSIFRLKLKVKGGESAEQA